MTHPPNKDFQKKLKFVVFSKKGFLWGLKNEFFKTNFQNQKGLQKFDTKHVSHFPKEDFQKKTKF